MNAAQLDFVIRLGARVHAELANRVDEFPEKRDRIDAEQIEITTGVMRWVPREVIEEATARLGAALREEIRAEGVAELARRYSP